MPLRTLVLLVGLALSSWGMATPAASQVMPFVVREPAGTLDLWTVPSSASAPSRVLGDVTFLPIRLAGAPRNERFRSDRPVPRGAGGPAPHILLPQGGALYRIRLPGVCALLHLGPGGSPRLVASLPQPPTGGPALKDWVFVSRDGRFAAVASTLAAGGDVLVLDLAFGPTSSPTADTPPLDVDALSLRASSAALWFVADGVLHRAAPGATQVTPLAVPAGNAWVLPELAMAAGGSAVAFVSDPEAAPGAGDTDDDARLFVAPATGPVFEVGDGDDKYEQPNYQHPRGPFLALNPSGTAVAFRWMGSSNSYELSMRRIRPSLGPVVQLTDAPTFYNYLDNIGVLSFQDDATLQFAVGDTEVSGQAADAMIAAGEVFVAVQSGGGSAPAVTNLTNTSGQSEPPFNTPGSVQFQDAVQTPSGAFLLLSGDEGDDGRYELTAVGAAGGPVLLMDRLIEAPELISAGQRVLVVSRHAVPLTQSPAGVRKRLSVLIEVGDELHVRDVIDISDALELARFQVDRTGRIAAFVARIVPGYEVPVMLDLQTQGLAKAWPTPLGISQLLAFSSWGPLFLGIGKPLPPYVFGGFVAPMQGFLVGLPLGDGFPLPH